MNSQAENPRAVIGGNAPPPTPFEIAKKAVEDIYDEALLWLDANPINSQELADGVGNLLAKIREAERLADEHRKKEKEPLDEAIKEIQSRYAPLIADTKAARGKTVLAAAACKAALAPWLLTEDRRLRAAAEAARESAERQRREAVEALRASDARNLAAREAAEALLRQATKAEMVANVAAKQTATAGGAFARAAGLRTAWRVTIINEVDAARTCWNAARPELVAFLQAWAERRVREGARSLPGFTIVEDKVAV